MAQQVLLKARGLYTFQNRFSAVPEGALLDAENVVVDRDGIIEPRRGQKIYGNAMGVSPTADYAHQLFTYKGRILRHYGAGSGSTIQYDSDGVGAFLSFLATYEEVVEGLRIKGIEVNGNFYLTTASGIMKISAASAATLGSATLSAAGGIKALDLALSINSQPGFFTQDSVVAYRIVWGIKDKNQNVILGTPSERVVLYNPITNLLIPNFNSLLTELDTVNSPGGISDQTYVTNLKTPLNSSAFDLRENLIALAAQIDGDTIITEAGIDTVSRQRITTTSGSVVFNSSIEDYLVVGNTITFTGFGLAEFNNNPGTITLISTTSVTNDTITFTPQTNYTGTDGSPVADTGGACQRLKYTLITEPNALSDIPTTAQLESMQNYYNSIVSQLSLEPVGIVPDPSIFAASAAQQSATVNVQFIVPDGVTTDHFYQIYRTALSTSTGTTVLSDLDPGDEEGLVYEDNPTSGEISAGSVTVQDIVPESFRGANLYTNPNSGEGIAQANEVPPLAKDMVLFKNTTFYANTQTKQRLNLSLLSVADLTSGVSTITISDGTTTNVYTFVSPVAEVTTVLCNAAATLASTGAGDYFTLNSAENTTQYYVWYNVDSGNTDPAISGKTGIEVQVSAADADTVVATKTKEAINNYSDFNVSASTATVTITNSDPGIATNAFDVNTGFTVSTLTQGAGEDAANKKVLLSDLSTPAQQVDETARSLSRVINNQSGEIVNSFYISGPNDVPGAILLEGRILGTDAFYVIANSTTTGSQFNPTLPTSGSSVISDNEVNPNRIYYSKLQQPEAVPSLNYIDVGPKDKEILRILALRDSLFVLKQEGIYRVTGDSAPFVQSLFDSSAILKAPDTAVVLNNQIYMISSQGVTTISDTGVDVISRPIEDQIIKLFSPMFPYFSKASFGVAYESDRSYRLWTVKTSADTKSTICYRFNTFTRAWTTEPTTKTCGIVNPTDDKLYLGAGDTNSIEQERKSFDRTDYADRQYDLTIGSNSITDNAIILSSVANVETDDVLFQKQYLTITQYNRVLVKLDNDGGTTFKQYYATLSAAPGATLRTNLTNLAVQLDSDNLQFTDYAADIAGYGSTFQDTQDAFNVIIGKLNNDSVIRNHTYLQSTGTVDQEVLISSVTRTSNTITTQYVYPFMAGPVTVFKHIITKVTWANQFFQDPSLLKQVREATLIFENIGFNNAELSFKSDLSPDFETQTFAGAGIGAFGYGIYGNENFGGNGSGIPFRTYIPLEKQRCRYLVPQFQHFSARESFSILGLSLTAEVLSPRAYR